MPKLGYRKDEALRTMPVTVSLPTALVEALDAELAASKYTSRSKLLADIITHWLETKPDVQPADIIEADLDRFRNFYMQ